MTGPEHYREAERLLDGRTFPADPELHIEERHEPPTAEDIAAAQVHATLALTAATAMQAAVDGSEPGMGSTEFHEWYQAAGVKPQPKGGNA
ncbi:hypothetical protein [Streptomyces sp. NPDC002573]|uniref:hypothetical protein n=1 Tax=Streptomyces sp. NPDC002573 TaxID=3364651 RepID=UPI00369440B6